MPYGLYPPGIRKALEFFKPLGVPLYLTEIGVADKGESVRRELIETYLPEVGGCEYIKVGQPETDIAIYINLV